MKDMAVGNVWGALQMEGRYSCRLFVRVPDRQGPGLPADTSGLHRIETIASTGRLLIGLYCIDEGLVRRVEFQQFPLFRESAIDAFADVDFQQKDGRAVLPNSANRSIVGCRINAKKNPL